MPRQLPHLGLMFDRRIPQEVIDDFTAQVAHPGLDLEVESRPASGPFAGIEWLLPTAIMLFITRSYFEGFLSEVGKDHYTALKSSIGRLRERFSRVPVTVVATPGKASAPQPYSLVFSVWVEGPSDQTLKFLIPVGDEAAAITAMDEFFAFLEAYSAGELEADHLALLASARQFGCVVPIAYNLATLRIEPIDPLTRSFPAPSARRDSEEEDW
jgi:hypothetical protein